MNLWLELVLHWHQRRTMKHLLMFENDERLLRASVDDVPRRKPVQRQLQPRLPDWLAGSPLGVYNRYLPIQRKARSYPARVTSGAVMPCARPNSILIVRQKI